MKQSSQTPLAEIGPYRLERLIARGGMGSVYLAQHQELRRKVALKVLSPLVDQQPGGAFEDRFRLEAETLAALNHPNIVTLYDYGETADGRFYLALEYIDGPRYTDLLRDGRMAPERVISLLLQVCKALRYAHKRGVVHRDLKPSNLLVQIDDDGEERLKVVDFGLVKVLEDDQSLTRTGLVLGSPHCMAPEQVRGEDVDHRADIYAMGILLFRSLAGRWPFHGETSAATMIAHINQPVPHFADVDPGNDVSAGLEGVARRCLRKRRSERYPDVQALTLALQQELVGAGADPTQVMGMPSLITAERSAPSMPAHPTVELPPLGLPPLTPPPPAWRPFALGAGGAALIAIVALWAWPEPSPAPVSADVTVVGAEEGEPAAKAGSAGGSDGAHLPAELATPITEGSDGEGAAERDVVAGGSAAPIDEGGDDAGEGESVEGAPEAGAQPAAAEAPALPPAGGTAANTTATRPSTAGSTLSEASVPAPATPESGSVGASTEPAADPASAPQADGTGAEDAAPEGYMDLPDDF